MKNQGKLRNKMKIKSKCNPYKNGPAEWKKVDYINTNSQYNNDEYVNNNQHKYRKALLNNSLDYSNKPYFFNGNYNNEYDIQRANGIFIPQGEEI